MSRYIHLQGSHPSNGIKDILVSEESFEGEPADYFTPGYEEITQIGIVRISADNANALPEILESA